MDTTERYAKRLELLKADLVDQGRRVQSIIESALDSFFNGDTEAASDVIRADDVIDQVDVRVEQTAVNMLTDAATSGVALSSTQIRKALVIVKLNNELERIADAGVTIAERVPEFVRMDTDIPKTFRVMANSVIGLLRDAGNCFDKSDESLARVVLQADEAIEAFKAKILKDAEQKIANGQITVEYAFLLHEIANECLRIADHCTNIAEQVIYLLSGTVVRHCEGQWVDVPRPDQQA